jgi:hypothetical protein
LNNLTPQSALFEGVAFFEYFDEFLVLRRQNIFGKTFEQFGIFDVLIGRFWPIPAIL